METTEAVRESRRIEKTIAMGPGPDAIRKSSIRTYKSVIDEESLSVYEQAAEQTGYGVKVTARAGEKILVQDNNEKPSHQVELSPGRVEVAVTIPLGQGKTGTTPFYDVVRELEQSLK